jgi:hypothetical protein
MPAPRAGGIEGYSPLLAEVRHAAVVLQTLRAEGKAISVSCMAKGSHRPEPFEKAVGSSLAEKFSFVAGQQRLLKFLQGGVGTGSDLSQKLIGSRTVNVTVPYLGIFQQELSEVIASLKVVIGKPGEPAREQLTRRRFKTGRQQKGVFFIVDGKTHTLPLNI